MKFKLIAITSAAVFCLNIARAQPVTTNVTTNPLWTDTGIAVTNGEYVNVNASGIWDWYAFNDPDGYLDPSDNIDTWVTNGLHGGLIAYVGPNPFAGSQWDSTNVFQPDEYWQVGTAGQFISNTNGELWLGVNDDAWDGAVSDNSGSNVATISLEFDTNAIVNTNFVLSFDQITTNQFCFTVNGGIPNAVCMIYSSADLIHWTLDDSLVLDSVGSSTNGSDSAPPSSSSGLRGGIFINNTAVPYRFYKASCGQFWTHTIGFVNIYIPAMYTNLIANQLDASPDNTLSSVFAQTSLPANVILEKFNSAGTVTNYTWNGSSWSGAATTTLAPGEGGMMCNTTSNAFTIVFVGAVREGTSRVQTFATNAWTTWSSVIPMAGGIDSQLNFPANPYNSGTGSGPLDNCYLAIWNPNALEYYEPQFDSNPNDYTPFTGFDDGANSVPQPQFRVGQAFAFYNVTSTNVVWTQTYSSYPLQHPPF